MEAGEHQHDGRFRHAEIVLRHLTIGDDNPKRRGTGEVEALAPDPRRYHGA